MTKLEKWSIIKLGDSMNSMIEVAFNSEEEAKETILKLLDLKLVSSAQKVVSQSSWHWHHNLEESLEYIVFFKTRKDLVNDIYNVIKEMHSYECFEFATWDISSTSREYLNWINEETS